MQMHKLRLFYIAMSTTSSIKGKQLPAHSVSFEIYTGIARFPCDSPVLVLHWHQSKTVKRYCMLSKIQYLRYDAESTVLRLDVSELTSSKSSLPRRTLRKTRKHSYRWQVDDPAARMMTRPQVSLAVLNRILLAEASSGFVAIVGLPCCVTFVK